jgi:ATP-dependent DNA helicase RecQ
MPRSGQSAVRPDPLAELGGISGVGAKKLEAYGTALLQVLEEGKA